MKRPVGSAVPTSGASSSTAKPRPRKPKRSQGVGAIVYVAASLGLFMIAYVTLDRHKLAEEGQRLSNANPPRGPIMSNHKRTGATKDLLTVQQSPQLYSSKPMGYRVIAQLHHDAGAFTQGLEFLAGRFIESTGIASTLREVEIMSGRVLRKVDLVREHFGEGCTVLKGLVYQLTWKNGVCLVYDLETFKEVNRFSYDTPGWGLANDGEQLIMTDGSDTVYFRDPATFQITKSLKVTESGAPVDRLNEIEYVRGEILSNVWFSDDLVRVSPEDGKVLGRVDLSGLHPQRSSRAHKEDVLNGIAWDEDRDRLWVTGKLWPSVFEIELVKPST